MFVIVCSLISCWLIQLFCSIFVGIYCLSASDCFELGRLAYLEKDYYHTVLWMHEALNRLEEDAVFHAAILDYLAYATYMVCVVFNEDSCE